MVLFRWFDSLLIVLILAAAVTALIFLRGSPGTKAEVYVSNKKVAYFNLNTDVQFREIEHVIGKSLIKYGEGSIRVVESPCPQKICMLRGAIQQSHERII